MGCSSTDGGAEMTWPGAIHRWISCNGQQADGRSSTTNSSRSSKDDEGMEYELADFLLLTDIEESIQSWFPSRGSSVDAPASGEESAAATVFDNFDELFLDKIKDEYVEEDEINSRDIGLHDSWAEIDRPRDSRDDDSYLGERRSVASDVEETQTQMLRNLVIKCLMRNIEREGGGGCGGDGSVVSAKKEANRDRGMRLPRDPSEMQIESEEASEEGKTPDPKSKRDDPPEEITPDYLRQQLHALGRGVVVPQGGQLPPQGIQPSPDMNGQRQPQPCLGPPRPELLHSYSNAISGHINYGNGNNAVPNSIEAYHHPASPRPENVTSHPTAAASQQQVNPCRSQYYAEEAYHQEQYRQHLSGQRVLRRRYYKEMLMRQRTTQGRE